MKDARIISISELLQLGRPLTGAASLSHHPIAPSVSTASPTPTLKHTAAEAALVLERAHFEHSAFHPLDFPVVLVGTLGLSGVGASHACGSTNHCFSFSDCSASVCCAILHLDITVIGKEIRVLSWNFFPFHGGGGVLEIIRWSLPNWDLGSGCDPSPSALVRFPQLEDRSRARSCAWGVLVSVSPVFSVPLAVEGDGCQGDPHKGAAGGAHSEGFLAEVSTCKCDPCTGARSVKDLHHCLKGRNGHSFDEQVFVYFRGPSSSWRPVLSKLVGKVVTISSLKKKYVYAGGTESLILASTERTVVYTDMKPVDYGIVERRGHLGMGQLGTYCGVVTGVFKKGMVVELDKKDVWLLSTDPLVDLPHSLRVGAVIIVNNAHFLHPNFSWLRILLLAICVKTTIEVKSFSPVHTRCHFTKRSHSLLWHFIDLLPFSARFWVLLLISSFQKKFAGIFSDKEILGSKKKEGLVQTYCKLSLPSVMFEHQLGVFEEFCKHDLCSCRKNLKLPPLQLVVPISSFIIKCKTIWASVLSQLNGNLETRRGNNNGNELFCEGMYHQRMIRRIISSEELGLVLVGSLQVSPSSGRLQLVDSTGCIDVVMPDLSPNFVQRMVYEVKDYTLIITGFPVQLDPLVLHQSDPLSCRSILGKCQLQEELHGLMIYVHFHIRNLRCLRTPFLPPVFRIDDAMGNTGGDFQLLLVTHKFLHVQNLQLPGHLSILNKSSAFAEAILLPYNLILLGKQQDIQLEVSEQLECVDNISCLVTFTNITYRGYIVPCNFSHRDGNSLDTSLDKHAVQRVLLEFEFGVIDKYQKLRIGTYYILKPSKNDVSYRTKGSAEFLDSSKAFVTLWSLNLSLGKLLHPCILQQDQPSGVSAVEDDVFPLKTLGKVEKLFHNCADIIHENLDAHLHLSNKAIELPKKAKFLENCLSKVHKILGEELSVSSFIQVMASMPLQPLGSFKHQGELLEGNLISLRGNIVDVHVFHHQNHKNKAEWSHICSRHCTMCVHVREGHHMVKIRGTFGISIYPLGMGPGANATFHRVLAISNSCGQYELMMVPVSFVVVNYVEQLDIAHCYRDLLPLPKSFISSSRLDTQNESLPVVSSGLISELIDYSHNTAVRLNCRVTGTFILSLEQVDKLKNLQSAQKCDMSLIRISLAGFILGDGSSSCCCWADGDRAEVLLQLRESAFQSFVSGHGTSKLMKNNHSQVTVGYLLKKVLNKHRRIMIRNYGAKMDSSFVDTMFSVDSKKAFTSSEEDVLRLIIMNAQNGPNLNVIGRLRNLNELPWPKEEFIEADFTEQSMKHLWAEEVVCANLLMESRNIMKELLPSE